uniref:hypothetical protein n=1 Tax=Enterococcus faecium TaxID=1352 RepID=UPI003DA15665
NERSKTHDGFIDVKYLENHSSNMHKNYKLFVKELGDNAVDLDTKITFANSKVTRDDYISKRLDYPIEKGSTACYEEIMTT